MSTPESVLVEWGVQRGVSVAVPLQMSATFILPFAGTILQRILFNNKHGLYMEPTIVGLGPLSDAIDDVRQSFLGKCATQNAFYMEEFNQ